MVQLVVGWDAAAPQPVHNPLLLHSLQRALQDPNISIFMSKAAGERVCCTAGRAYFFSSKCALLACVVFGRPMHNSLLLHSLLPGPQDPNISIFMSIAAGKRVCCTTAWHLIGQACAPLAKTLRC
jgi:hypothetical protein